jgi:hypothetical protein
MTDGTWYYLADAEATRLNPPDDADERDEWLPVGYIPRPSTRFGWFVYHVVHGLWMHYPPHKVFGYALANTEPSLDVIDLTESDLHYLAVSESLRHAVGELARRGRA